MTTEILRRRAEIERDIEGRTICDHLRETAENSGGAPALSDQAGDGTGWQTLTWAQTRQQVLELAAGFAALGLAKGERVALMLPNRSEHVLADLAAVHAGGTPVTFYATLAADQIAFVAGDCDARIAVLDGAAELARWQPILDRLPGAEEDHRQGPGRLPGRGSVPDLGRLRRAGPGAVRCRSRRRQRADRGRRGRTTRSPCCTPRAPPATPRASCSPTTTCSTRWRPTVARPAPWQPGAAGLLPAAGPHRRAHAQHLPARRHRRPRPLLPDADRAGRGCSGRSGRPASSACRRVWEKVRAGIQALLDHGAGRGQAGGRRPGHGHRAALRREPPVRPLGAARPGRGVRPGRRRPCWRRSGRCSASARRRWCPAPRRRCRRT